MTSPLTPLDRTLRDMRIRQALRHIPAGATVLDIGTLDGALFEQGRPKCLRGVGLDPNLSTAQSMPDVEFVRDEFPTARPLGTFDVVTALAVVEHIPLTAQHQFARACFDALRDGGLLVLTIPSPLVDTILVVLRTFRLVHGMSLEQHYGYDVSQTPALFGGAGLELVERRRFQLGLNNVFVFRRPPTSAPAPSTPDSQSRTADSP